MGKYFLDKESVKISFPDGEWVAVKEELTQEDQDYILTEMAQAQTKGKDNKAQFSLGSLSLLERSIVDWSFEENGQKVPVTRDNVSRLRRRYREKTLAEINRLNISAIQFSKNSPRAST